MDPHSYLDLLNLSYTKSRTHTLQLVLPRQTLLGGLCLVTVAHTYSEHLCGLSEEEKEESMEFLVQDSFPLASVLPLLAFQTQTQDKIMK